MFIRLVHAPSVPGPGVHPMVASAAAEAAPAPAPPRLSPAQHLLDGFVLLFCFL